MILTNDNTEQIIRADNRKYSADVRFSFLSCKTPESIRILAKNAQDGSVPDQIVYPYLSHIADRFFIKSKMHSKIFPNPENLHKTGKIHRVKNRSYPRIGYIGGMADANGSFKESEKITLFLPETNLKKITLITNNDRIIKHAVVFAKTFSGGEAAKYEIKNNDSPFLIFDLPCEKARVLEIDIKKHTANKRVWILAFYPGFEFYVNEKDVVKIKHSKKKTENKEGSIGRLYINSVDIELNNLTRIYDIANDYSPLQGYFNNNAVCDVKLSLEQPEGLNPFILNFGTFYITKIKNDESKGTVQIQAQDFIGASKDKYLSLGIQENSNAYECFSKIAAALNLSSSKLDDGLKQIKFKRLPLTGTASSLLNRLCVMSNAYCACSDNGADLIAVLLNSKHGGIRYPLRYFLLNEFKTTSEADDCGYSPNVINLSYSAYEYEGELQAALKDVVFYSKIEKKQFPETYKHTEYGNYPIGGGLTPSFSKTYQLPENFEKVEFSDPFIPKCLEHSVKYTYDDSGKAIQAAVDIWNFSERSEGEQLTVMIIVRQKPIEILLKKDEFSVPKRPANYNIPPIPPSNFIASNMFDVMERNSKNKPVEFKIELKDTVSIARVEVANRFIPCKFEFAYLKTDAGIHVFVWNYFENHNQTVTVNIYGSRLVAGKEKKIITARNEADILEHGEISKNIDMGSIADDITAMNILNSTAYFYKHFTKNLAVQTWSDPRLTLYDLIAFKSLRGYGFKQGIIEDIDLEFKGYLTQKLKLKQTKKHNRDSRILAGAVVNDRPMIPKRYLKYV